MREAQITLLSSGDMTGDLTSTGIALNSTYAYSIQGIWSGGSAPVGTFKLQGSDDAGYAGGAQPTNWSDVTSSSQAISGTPGKILYDVTECSYRWVRLVYTHTSGSATLNVTINTKGI